MGRQHIKHHCNLHTHLLLVFKAGRYTQITIRKKSGMILGLRTSDLFAYWNKKITSQYHD